MKTPPTIPAPLPADPRLLRLAAMLSVSKRDALGATVEAWAWIDAQATGGIVPQPVALLDTVAEIEGFGEAAVAVGLVGTADGHIVAPAELRQAHAQGTARRSGTADAEKRKAYEREKKRKQRKGSRLTGKPKTTTPKGDAPAAATTPSRKPRRLGTLPGGYDVMLFWSKTNEGWFYKVPGSVPDLTGTVTDQNNPTLADALKALLDARLTQVQKAKGRLDDPTFSPSMEQLVAAARREQADRQAAAVAAARVDEGNEAFARAAADDAEQDDAEPGSGERFSELQTQDAKSHPTPTGDIEPADAPGDRSTSSPDSHAEPVPATADAQPDDVADDRSPTPPADAQDGDIQGTTRGQHGDMGTCPQNVPIAATGDRVASPSSGNGLDAAPCPPKCPQDTTGTSPSSSSSSLNEEEKEEDTTTTRATADAERDAPGTAEQDDDFSRYLKATDRRDDFDRYLTAAGTAPPVDPATAERIQRLAAALDTTPEAVREQGRYRPDVLDARLRAVGIDPATGFPMAARHAEPGDQGTADRLAAALPGDDAPRSPQDAPGAPQATGTGVQSVSSGQASGGIVAAPVTTPPAAGSPTPSRALRRSGLSHALDILTDGLDADDQRDHERDIGSPPTSAAADRLQSDVPAELLSDADTVRLRNKALRDIAAFSTTTTTSVTVSVTPANC